MKITLLKPKNNKMLAWTIEYDEHKYRVIYGTQNGKMVESQWSYPVAKNVGKKNETSLKQQVESEVSALVKKKRDAGYNETGIQMSILKPMLAMIYKDYKDTLSFPVYIQPKLDGIRCLLTNDGIRTRNGEKIPSCPHIEHLSLTLPNAAKFFDGELYNHELQDNFNKIVSLVKKQKPEDEDLLEAKKMIKYYVYDINMPGSFSQRYEVLKEMFKNNSEWVLVPTFSCNSVEEVEKYNEEFLKQGYEGSIVRVDQEYEEKRSKYLLKLKSFKDEEFEILDIMEGAGNRRTMVGYLRLKTKTGKEFKSSLKGTWEYAKEVLQNRTQYIGTFAKVKFFDYTPDGIPRFPVAIELNRTDNIIG